MDEQHPPDPHAAPPMPPPPTAPPYRAASQPPTGAPLPSQAVTSARRQAGVLVTFGGVMVVVGVFLPWVSATGPGGTVSENGISIGTYGTLILGAFAVARGMSMIRPSSFGFNLGTPLIGGILLAVLMALRWSFLQDQVRGARAVSPLIHASIGIGAWAVVAGTALILAGSLLAQRRR